MNTLYYGDNLPILQSLPSESVDLVYLDPPFNSSRNYNVLFKDQSGVSSDAQIVAFDDTWSWGPSAEQAYHQLLQDNPGVVDDIIAALRKVIGENQMMAYLVMMAARLVELHRVLKPTGSLYLHCDPTASHYLKVILDTVFGGQYYRNEIIWQRTNVHSDSKTWSAVSDTIFFYTKSDSFTWNPIYLPHSDDYLASKYRNHDPDGRVYTLDNMTSPNPRPNMMYEWKGHAFPPNGWRYSRETMSKLDAEGRIWYPSDKSKRPRLKRYLDEMPGRLVGTVWTDIFPINSQAAERLGYPTQKPLALLERIVQASSNPGDVVLDPFCGCGTAIAAAEKLGRKWLGIDITYLAINLIENRMKHMFPSAEFQVVGKPKDLASARDLALRDRYQFQWWALSLVGAKPVSSDSDNKGKKGKDKGIDGIINYIDTAKSDLKRVIVQVKSGHVNSATIRDLRGVLDREQAEIGVLITLEPATKDMITEASSMGLYTSQFWQKTYPRLQILTIEQILSGVGVVQMPPETGTFLAAQKVKKADGQQLSF